MTEKTPLELSRERFEAWQKGEQYGEPDPRGAFCNSKWVYVRTLTQQRWESWEASRQTAERDALERAAKVAETTGKLEKANPDDWCSKDEARCQIAVDVVVETRQQIAQAIRSLANG